LAKYGGYGDYNGECDSKLIEGYQMELPYWKAFGNNCFPTPSVKFESELKDTIFEKFGQYLGSIKDKFSSELTIPKYLGGGNENCPASYTYSKEEKTCICDFSEEEEELCYLGIQYYTSVKIFDDLTIVHLPATDKMKFANEKLELTDDITLLKTVKILLGKLIDIGEENFVNKDPVSSSIENANQKMNSVAYPGATKDCKAISNFQECGTEPTKKFMLDTTCPNAMDKFKGKTESEISDLDNSLDTDGIKVSLTIKDLKLDVDDESEFEAATCTSLSPEPDSDSCSCIAWMCPYNEMGVPDAPVEVGDSVPNPKLLASKLNVPSDTKCAPCVEITEDGECRQWVGLSCPPEYPVDLGGVAVASIEDGVEGIKSLPSIRFAPILPPVPPAPVSGCVQVANKVCPVSYPVEFDGQCVKTVSKECNEAPYTTLSGDDCIETPCPGDPCDTIPATCPDGFVSYGAGQCRSESPVSKTCPSDYPVIHSETQCRTNPPVPKVCPSGTTKFGDTKRCYSDSAVAPSCQLKDTLYTKSCSYNYKATANVLINAKDTVNEYQVYASVEDNTGMRNLELQFYVLSKN
ncbi:MAG: hypothetical protein HYS80_00930, partial [Candidatus Aenigmarchaeota archaeon]|nr:hypothetical protein [Candidatus Aenigmarchaeota archaeon]